MERSEAVELQVEEMALPATPDFLERRSPARERRAAERYLGGFS